MPDLDSQRLATLEAEAAVRRLAARYMALCDEPAPITPGRDFADLFTADVVWEGIGRRAGAEFPRVAGREALLVWFDSMRSPPKYAFNAHFLTSESIEVEANGHSARGHWLMFQAAARNTGEGELRMARIVMQFRQESSVWRIAHFQTESLYRLDASGDQAAALLAGVQ